MRSEVLLRSASVLMLVHTIGHTFGTLGWKKTTDPAKREVINQMTGHKFPFMGATHSMGDAMDGYGFALTLALFLITALLWLSSNYVVQNPTVVKKILILLSIVLLLQVIVELIYFFPLAAVFTFIATLLTVVAIFQISQTSK